MINGPNEVYVERFGQLEKTDASFDDADALLSVARNIAQFTNKRITETTARFDSRLPDGSRIHVVMPRCSRTARHGAVSGAIDKEEVLCIAIRKFSPLGLSLERMVESGSLSEEVKEYLEIVVELEQNLMISGGTGSGKTTFLNALSLKIPPTERIIVIEDTSELQLRQPHVLYFETAPPDRYGHGGVTIRDLFNSALRMRPDRIVIGECRGGEALDLIQAMTSGHGGSMSTLHANNCTDALNRLETMALMSEINIPIMALRPQVASAIDAVIQLSRLSDGRRLVTEISEVHKKLTPENRYEVNPVFKMEDMRDKSGTLVARLVRTGQPSIFAEAVRTKGLSSRIVRTKRLFASPS
jgi:pilus assembly protein CpaF